MSDNSTAEIFSRAAPDFDQTGPRFFSQSGRRLVELANIPKSSRVLDVACGRGAVLFSAAEEVGAQGQVFGMDLADGMIRHTYSDLRDLGAQNIHLSRMDAIQLAYASESFNFVLCSHSIGFFPEALSEFFRVLKPGGKAALSNIVSGCFEWLQDIFSRYNPPDEPDEENELERLELDIPAGMESALRATGFTQIQIHTERIEMIYPDKETWWRLLWTVGFRRSLESMQDEKREQLRNDLFQELQKFKQPDGLHIPFITLFAICSRSV